MVDFTPTLPDLLPDLALPQRPIAPALNAPEPFRAELERAAPERTPAPPANATPRNVKTLQASNTSTEWRTLEPRNKRDPHPAPVADQPVAIQPLPPPPKPEPSIKPAPLPQAQPKQALKPEALPNPAIAELPPPVITLPEQTADAQAAAELEALFPEWGLLLAESGTAAGATAPTEAALPAAQPQEQALPWTWQLAAGDGQGDEAAAAISARDRRYGLGFGKPFAGHAAVNRRHLDRFGRPIPLTETQIASFQLRQTRTVQMLPAAPQAPATFTLPRPAAGAPAPAPMADSEWAQRTPDLPVLGQPVNEPLARTVSTRLSVATPGFEPVLAKAQPAVHQPAVQSEAPLQPPPAITLNVPMELSQGFGSFQQSQSQHQQLTGEPKVSTPANGIALTAPDRLPSELQAAEAAAKAAATPRAVAVQVAQRMLAGGLAEGASRLRFTLRPPELGQITIELMRQGDQLSARILTRTPEAQQLFDRLLPDLRQQLEDRGFILRQLDLAYQGAAGDGGERARQPFWTPPQEQRWEMPPLTPEEEALHPDLPDLWLELELAGVSRLNVTV